MVKSNLPSHLLLFWAMNMLLCTTAFDVADGGKATGSNKTLPLLHGESQHLEARTNFDGTVTTSYYNIGWKKTVPTGCDPDGPATIDLECYDSTIALSGITEDASCFPITDDTLRCQALPNIVSSAVVSCTGTRVPQTHSLLMRMPSTETPTACTTCGIYSNTALIYRKCRTEESTYNTELFPSFFCSGLQDADECFEAGLLITDLFCLAGDTDGLLAIAADAETDRCIYDAEEEGLAHTEKSLDERLHPLVQALMSDSGGTAVTATYRLFYGYRKDESAAACEIPMGDVYFVCANGRLPELTSFTDACGVVTLSSGENFRRCMAYDFSDQRADATCQGGSEEEVQLLAFQPASSLPACQDTQESQAKALLWVAELCEEEQVPGGSDSVSCSSSELALSNEDTLWNCAGACFDNECNGLPALLLTKQATICFTSTLPPETSCGGFLGTISCWIKSILDFIFNFFS